MNNNIQKHVYYWCCRVRSVLCTLLSAQRTSDFHKVLNNPQVEITLYIHFNFGAIRLKIRTVPSVNNRSKGNLISEEPTTYTSVDPRGDSLEIR